MRGIAYSYTVVYGEGLGQLSKISTPNGWLHSPNLPLGEMRLGMSFTWNIIGRDL